MQNWKLLKEWKKLILKSKHITGTNLHYSENTNNTCYMQKIPGIYEATRTKQVFFKVTFEVSNVNLSHNWNANRSGCEIQIQRHKKVNLKKILHRRDFLGSSTIFFKKLVAKISSKNTCAEIKTAEKMEITNFRISDQNTFPKNTCHDTKNPWYFWYFEATGT